MTTIYIVAMEIDRCHILGHLYSSQRGIYTTFLLSKYNSSISLMDLPCLMFLGDEQDVRENQKYTISTASFNKFEEVSQEKNNSD